MNKTVKRAVRLVGNILAVLVLLVGIVGLNVLVERTNQARKEARLAASNRLNVAVVNEDQSVLSQDGRDTYALGDDYLKTLERDDSQNWTVTTRASAESGLKSGRYQLIIFIPSDFSSKVLDINNVLVDKTTVTYKINAKGSAKVEADAQSVGSKVVSDLNSRLVNMYMASVLGNLYTAQENAKAVSAIQSGNIGDYQNNLLDSAVNFENVFPSLVSLSDGANQSNQGLTQGWNKLIADANRNNPDTDKMQEDLVSLTTDYSTGAISQEEMTSGLMQMDASQLDSQITQMIAELEADQTAVSSQLQTPTSSSSQGATTGSTNGSTSQGSTTSSTSQTTSGSTTSSASQASSASSPTTSQSSSNQSSTSPSASAPAKPSYEEVVNQASSQLDALEKQLQTAQSTNGQAPSKPVKDIVDDFLITYFGKNGVSDLKTITLEDVLTKQNSSGTGLYSQDLAAYTKSLDDMVATTVALLPTDCPGDLADLSGVTTVNYGAQISAYDANHPASSYGYTPSDSAGLGTSLAQSAKAVRDFNKTQVAPTSSLGQVTATLNDSAGLVDKWYVQEEGSSPSSPVSANQSITLDPSKKNTVHYIFKADAMAQAPANASLSVTLGDTTVSSTKGQSVDFEAYAKVVESYAKSAQAVVDAYNQSGRLLSSYYPNGSQTSLTQSFFDQSAYDFLSDILVQVVSQAVGTYSGNVDVSAALTTLKGTRETLLRDLQDVMATNNQVEADIADTLTLLKTIQGGGNTQSSETETAAAKDAADKKAKAGSDLSSDLATLIAQSESLKASAQSNAESADAVSETFRSFNESAKDAQVQGQALSAEAQKLMTAFSKELSDTNDFVGSFKTVLDNAYQEGVPNEALLEFLSSPVVSRSSSTQAQVDTYRPFTWILLLAVITLFTAYLFATQDLLSRVRNRFKQGVLADTDPLNVGTISALGLVEGLVLGITSARYLHVTSDQVPSWILIFVLYALILLLGQYFLLKRMRAIGMGLSLYTLVSFVYFSGAVGASSGLTGSLRKLKVYNLLSHMEKTLSAYFDTISVSAKEIFILMLAVALLVVLNTVFRLPWEKKAQTDAVDSAA